MSMRRLGIFGENLPTKKERAVNPADFTIAGLYGSFNRKYNRTYRFRSAQEALLVLGAQTNPAWFGWDCLNGFFANLQGQSGSIIVASYPGIGATQASKNVGVTAIQNLYTAIAAIVSSAGAETNDIYLSDVSELQVGDVIRIGGTIVATVDVIDTVNKVLSLNTPVTVTVGMTMEIKSDENPVFTPFMTFKAAYQNEPEFGAAANRTGIQIVKGSAFNTNVVSVDGVNVVLESVVGIRVGDTLFSGSFLATVADLNEQTNTVTLAAETGFTSGMQVGVMAYQIKTFLRLAKGAVEEVDLILGRVWVTTNVNDPDRYMVSVLNPQSAYLQIQEIGDVPLVGLDAIDTVVYLQGGTDGTSLSSQADFEAIWGMMDEQPIRIVAACESSNQAVQSSLETYCKNRTADNPIAMIVGQMDMNSKSQIIFAGQAFQRSNEVDAVYIHNWLSIADPFASSNMVRRIIPNVGHTMGQWIQSIGLNGIHSSPARKDVPLVGVSEVVGYQALNDFDRTDLAEAGVNVIQQLTGRGFIVRNHFTPSTADEFKFSNGVIQRNFIKVSVVDSLQTSENMPNTFRGVTQDRMTILQFMIKLWNRGSTGSVPTGDTFGQYIKEDGSQSGVQEAFEVIGDASNNDAGSLQRGERNFDIYFMFPAPAGSIRIGVGILYRVS